MQIVERSSLWFYKIKKQIGIHKENFAVKEMNKYNSAYSARMNFKCAGCRDLGEDTTLGWLCCLFLKLDCCRVYVLQYRLTVWVHMGTVCFTQFLSLHTDSAKFAWGLLSGRGSWNKFWLTQQRWRRRVLLKSGWCNLNSDCVSIWSLFVFLFCL